MITVSREPALGVVPLRRYRRYLRIDAWAEASTVLATTMLALGSKQVPFVEGPAITPLHDAAYWQRVTAAFDFSEADQVPPARFNRVLWNGLMGDRPYPIRRGGAGTSKTH